MFEAFYNLYVIGTTLIEIFMLAIPCVVVVAFSYITAFGVTMFFHFAAFVYKFSLWLSLVPITYHGLEHIPQEPSIFIANHASSLDIILMGKIMGNRSHTWLAKEELWNYPLFPLLLNRFAIPVSFAKKADPMVKQLGVVDRAKKRLDEGSSVILFPEGGRHNDGTIHPFRSGFAALAFLTGKPVVPVFLHGVGKVMPPGSSFLKQRSPIEVVVGPPFIYQLTESIEEFKKRVFLWYCAINEKFNRQEALMADFSA